MNSMHGASSGELSAIFAYPLCEPSETAITKSGKDLRANVCGYDPHKLHNPHNYSWRSGCKEPDRVTIRIGRGASRVTTDGHCRRRAAQTSQNAQKATGAAYLEAIRPDMIHVDERSVPVHSKSSSLIDVVSRQRLQYSCTEARSKEAARIWKGERGLQEGLRLDTAWWCPDSIKVQRGLEEGLKPGRGEDETLVDEPNRLEQETGVP
ncbi:hypothetical protein FB451DRAFT_1167970 [Mycena latifolia]|nr:hypothetical protein FB451DRAFT_1167970 [Mycena latifolia]